MAGFQDLRQFLSDSGELVVSMTFSEIEKVIGRSLPPSAHKHAAFWANSERNAYGRHWLGAGYRATRSGGSARTITFVRFRGPKPVEPPINHVRQTRVAPSVTKSADIIVIGCVSQKRSTATPAKDLYTSGLFAGRRRYAERNGAPWVIASALHGVVEPDEVIEPYDVSLKELPPAQKWKWGRIVAEQLVERFGNLSGKVIEIHAGAAYCEGLVPTLREQGAHPSRPLMGLKIGEQLRWYASGDGTRSNSLESPRPSPNLSRRITEEFTEGRLDLSRRQQAPPPGWNSMPEVVVANDIRASGAPDQVFRLLSTFVSALDRARDADRLWSAAHRLFIDSPWTYDPTEVVRHSFTELSDQLIKHKVSQRHLPDSAAWLRIAETLASTSTSRVVHRAVFEGKGDTQELLLALADRTAAGTARFPYLGGPKVGPMWIRILAYPGNATISSLELLPVAVDVQVRKVSEYLGATGTYGQELELVRNEIQEAWSRDVTKHGAEGPPSLVNTPAALDPALWFFAKWGCSFCERANERMPISPICGECIIESLRSGSTSEGQVP